MARPDHGCHGIVGAAGQPPVFIGALRCEPSADLGQFTSCPCARSKPWERCSWWAMLWGLAYQRTGTLRWCVVGHMLANLLGLAALVLLNLVDPTVRVS